MAVTQSRPHLRGTPSTSRAPTISRSRSVRRAASSKPYEGQPTGCPSFLSRGAVAGSTRSRYRPSTHPSPARPDSPAGQESCRGRRERGELRHLPLLIVAAAGVAGVGASRALTASTTSRAEQPWAERVLLLSVDGLHQSDLDWYIDRHPSSALAKLTHKGVEFTHAQTP